MSQDGLTHRDLAALLGVSETTVKSYRRKFPGCFPVAARGKPIRFKKEAGEIALRIRELFTAGLAVEELGAQLSREFPWFSFALPEKETEDDRDISGNFASALSSLARGMATLTRRQQDICERLERMEQQLLGLSTAKPPDQADPGAMIALPLVTRAEDGSYHSAGGARGVLSLQDLQSLLDQQCLPPEHFKLSWAYEEGNWWFFLTCHSVTSPAQSVRIAVQAIAIRSARNLRALLVRACLRNDMPCPFAEIIPSSPEN